MKNTFKISAISLTIGLIIGIASISLAQPPSPPPPPDHGSSGNQAPGGMAPVGSGIALLIGLGTAYGSRKIFKAWKKLEA